eukprot:3206784-Prymnesium_polylepis.1
MASSDGLDSAKLADLRQIIDDEGLPVSKEVGGKAARTIEQMVSEIRKERAAREPPGFMPTPPRRPVPTETTPTTGSGTRTRSAAPAPEARETPIVLSVTADSSLEELRRFIDLHDLPVSKAIGGRRHRTKAHMFAEI